MGSVTGRAYRFERARVIRDAGSDKILFLITVNRSSVKKRSLEGCWFTVPDYCWSAYPRSKMYNWINFNTPSYGLKEEYHVKIFVPVCQGKQVNWMSLSLCDCWQWNGRLRMYFEARRWIRSTLQTSSIDWGAHTCVAYPRWDLNNVK